MRVPHLDVVRLVKMFVCLRLYMYVQDPCIHFNSYNTPTYLSIYIVITLMYKLIYFEGIAHQKGFKMGPDIILKYYILSHL